MDIPLDTLIHWIPTPLLALGFWALMKKAFQDHELRFSNLVQKFESAVDKMQGHELALGLLKAAVDRQELELQRLRDRHHAFADFIMEMQANLLVEGSAPKRDPRLKPESD